MQSLVATLLRAEPAGFFCNFTPMHTIENSALAVIINPAGAELTSIFCKTTRLEYLWNGNANFWGKRSPVLFPIVGSLKNNTYFFDDKGYQLSRHGFARDKTFLVAEEAEQSISFFIQDDDSTFTVFPFHFTFSIIYTIAGNKLSVTYLVKNTGTNEMYFSFGGHPAFKLPIADDAGYEDYFLLFNRTETAGRWPISHEGLIEEESRPLLDNTNKLALSKELFHQDAIVFKDLMSDVLQLRTAKSSPGLDFSFAGFPCLGIWAAKDADFICIEPWCGIADSVNTKQDLRSKEGIMMLMPSGSCSRSWSVTVW